MAARKLTYELTCCASSDRYLRNQPCLKVPHYTSKHNSSETSNVVRVGDGGTDEKTGGGDGGGRVEDVTIFIRSDNVGGYMYRNR